MSSHDELIRQTILRVTQSLADIAERMSREPSARELPGNVALALLAQTIRDTNNKFAEALAEQHTKH